MRNFSYYRFFKAFIAIGVLTLVSFFAFVSEDRHVFAPNILLTAFSDLYSIFKFPLLTFFWDFFSLNPVFYFFALVINCLFYAIIFEWIYLYIKNRKEDLKKEEPKSDEV
jgi:hypothetical protein